MAHLFYQKDFKIYSVETMHEKYAHDLEELQFLAFPDLDDSERIKAQHYAHHIQLFPEGQFVIVHNGKAIASTTTIRYHYDIEHLHHHTFAEVLDGGWLNTHEPNGEWLYGVDVSVHPNYRNQGLGKALYQARQFTVAHFNLKGQLTFGMLRGFRDAMATMTIDAYFDKVKKGDIFDPTVSMQMKAGFKIIGLEKDYLSDESCQGYSAIMIMDPKHQVM